MIKFWHNLALFWVKNANFFRQIFGRKYFRNHNIGPWTFSGSVGPCDKRAQVFSSSFFAVIFLSHFSTFFLRERYLFLCLLKSWTGRVVVILPKKKRRKKTKVSQGGCLINTLHAHFLLSSFRSARGPAKAAFLSSCMSRSFPPTLSRSLHYPLFLPPLIYHAMSSVYTGFFSHFKKWKKNFRRNVWLIRIQNFRNII
jgi:hypothetical protein